MSAKHTPTPWTVIADMAGCSTIVDPTDFEIASHVGLNDAEFIVDVVNSHNELLAAIERRENHCNRLLESNAALLKVVNRHAEWIKRNPDVQTIEDRDWLKAAEKAAAQAEGKS